MSAYGSTHLNIDLSTHPPLIEPVSDSDSDADTYLRPVHVNKPTPQQIQELIK